jgi:hypothetical protein
MKTKNYFAFTILALYLMLNLNSSAQTIIPFTNLLNCDVTVGYEERDPNGFCSVCQSGTFIISAGSTFNYVSCIPNFIDACIWVIDIGGTSISTGGCTNHFSCTSCCQIPITGQAGTCGAVGCFTGGWTIQSNLCLPPYSWTIQ